MLELTLVRHASTALNEAHRYQGWLDPPLSQRGRAEALRLRGRLRGGSFDRVLCSDLRRSVETVGIALPDRTPETDARLRELDFGSWDGRTYEECLELDRARLTAWIDDPVRLAPPGGESVADFGRRVDAALQGLGGEGRILIVTHGGPIRLAVARLLALDWSHVSRMQLSPASLTRLAVHPEGGHLLTLNDTAHLDGVDLHQPREGARA